MADLAVQSEACVLHSLLVVGVNLTTVPDRHRMLNVILREARRLVAAEAGTLYTVRGGLLRFAAAQNDSLEMLAMHEHLLDRELPITAESQAGFAAMTGQAVNVPDAAHLPPGAPFRICRRLDSATGYRTGSILALPLMCPDGHCVGVLQLINHIESDGTITPFEDPGDGVRSLAAMAAVTLHNHQLQEQLRQAHLETIMRLSVAAEYRDDDTGEHVRRISGTSAILAEELGLGEQQGELVRWASPMHDIGKIGIADAILLKPGPLDERERRVMERHTLIGAGILGEPKNELMAMAREVALAHHERWDGGGYPHGWAGEDIPLAGRIVGCADVFDALVCKRCYKKAFPQQVALRILEQESGKHFDPRVVAAFLKRRDEIVGAYGAPVTGDRTP